MQISGEIAVAVIANAGAVIASWANIKAKVASIETKVDGQSEQIKRINSTLHNGLSTTVAKIDTALKLRPCLRGRDDDCPVEIEDSPDSEKGE